MQSADCRAQNGWEQGAGSGAGWMGKKDGNRESEKRKGPLHHPTISFNEQRAVCSAISDSNALQSALCTHFPLPLLPPLLFCSSAPLPLCASAPKPPCSLSCS